MKIASSCLDHLLEALEEPLWFWDISSDKLCLSAGALNKLGLSPEEAPADMNAFLTRLPPAEQDTVRHALEEFLSSGEQLFRQPYFFNNRQILGHAVVFRRDEGGRPTQLFGCLEYEGKKKHIPLVGHAVAYLDRNIVHFDRSCAILFNRDLAAPFDMSLPETAELVHENERWQLQSLRRIYVPGSPRDQFEENLLLRQNGGTYTRLNVNISVKERDSRGPAPLWQAHCSLHSAI